MRSPSWESFGSVSPRLRPEMIATGTGPRSLAVRRTSHGLQPTAEVTAMQRPPTRNGILGCHREGDSLMGEGCGLDHPTRNLVREMTGADERTQDGRSSKGRDIRPSRCDQK